MSYLHHYIHRCVLLYSFINNAFQVEDCKLLQKRGKQKLLFKFYIVFSAVIKGTHGLSTKHNTLMYQPW